MIAEGRLPSGRRLVGARETVLVGALLQEDSRGEERTGGDSGYPIVVYRELSSDRFLLGVLKMIDVLEEVWVFGPPAEGGGEEGNNVGGFEAAAAALEASEKFSEGHLVVKG